MNQDWRQALGAVLALLGALVTAVLPRGHAAAAEQLETQTLSTYDVRSDGSVRVTVAAQVVNRDPSTQRRTSGQVYFYSATAFAVHESASDIVVRSGGTLLATEAPAPAAAGSDPFRLVGVRFHRDLYYNESLEIRLEYHLTAVRAAQTLVNRQYAFVPAIAQGTRSLVRITAPADRRVTIGSSNCARTADSPVTYTCGASTAAADYGTGGRCAFTVAAPRWDCAFTGRDFVLIPFEAAASDLSLATRSSRVMLARGEVLVSVQYFAGDEAWAARVDDLIRRGLPLLEEANGFPYAGPPSIEVVESGYRDTHGYEGTASSQGRIRLTPIVDDQTVLHEVAHLWSGVFGSRWLAEGMADFTANLAAQRLGMRPEAAVGPLPVGPRLEEWGAPRSQLAVGPTERESEEAGYARSQRFVEILAERAGPRSLAAANARLQQEKISGTARTYLDLLEEVSGAPLTALFAEWALSSADLSLLPARQSARSRAEALRIQAGGATPLPGDLAEALRAWDFERAERLIALATTALETHTRTAHEARAGGYDLGDRFTHAFAEGAEAAEDVAQAEAEALLAVTAAGARLHESRSPLMRLGLLGVDLGRLDTAARSDLARGEYDGAVARAGTIERRLDSASRDGAIRLGIAGLIACAVSGMLLIGIRRRG